VRVNYPCQAATLTGFRFLATDVDPLPPNIGAVILSDDASVQENNEAPGGIFEDGAVGPYSGPYGLGRQLAFAGRVVRPFRKLVSAQAIYRREVVE